MIRYEYFAYCIRNSLKISNLNNSVPRGELAREIDEAILVLAVDLGLQQVSPILLGLLGYLPQVIVVFDVEVLLEVGQQVGVSFVQNLIHPPHEAHLPLQHALLYLQDIRHWLVAILNAVLDHQRPLLLSHQVGYLESFRGNT